MNCNCSVCDGKDFNPIGLQLAEKEIIPFVKKDLLKLNYPEHPFPRKYTGLLASLFAYGQALAYNRAHSLEAIYYTDSKWMLKYSSEFGTKFGMPTKPISELPKTYSVACEFNVKR